MPNRQERREQDRRDKAAFSKMGALQLELFDHNKATCECRVELINVEFEPGREILQVLHFDTRRKLVWFAILHNRIKDGRGTELYSVDTSHGHFHEHTTGHRTRKDRKDISPLYSQVDVQECFNEGYDLVFDKYQVMSGR